MAQKKDVVFHARVLSTPVSSSYWPPLEGICTNLSYYLIFFNFISLSVSEINQTCGILGVESIDQLMIRHFDCEHIH